ETILTFARSKPQNGFNHYVSLGYQPSAYAYRLYLVKERLLLQTHSAKLIRFASFLSASAAERRTIRTAPTRVNYQHSYFCKIGLQNSTSP
ncbi:hypothetical protein, partial [Chitinimonas sp. BJB300]|uniref:hypothetical protein n=1 Tax=Chitinimonas sp. BJB300 TaxID=1559339 RepID=UPI001C902EE3